MEEKRGVSCMAWEWMRRTSGEEQVRFPLMSSSMSKESPLTWRFWIPASKARESRFTNALYSQVLMDP
jgi:hypothetical protein